MNKIFIVFIVSILIFILTTFLIVSYVASRVGTNTKELRSELESIQAPIYTPMGIYTAFMKFILSILSMF